MDHRSWFQPDTYRLNYRYDDKEKTLTLYNVFYNGLPLEGIEDFSQYHQIKVVPFTPQEYQQETAQREVFKSYTTIVCRLSDIIDNLDNYVFKNIDLFTVSESDEVYEAGKYLDIVYHNKETTVNGLLDFINFNEE